MSIISTTIIVDSIDMESIYADINNKWCGQPGLTLGMTFSTFLDFVCDHMHMYQRDSDVSLIADLLWYHMGLPVISEEAFLLLCQLCRELKRITDIYGKDIESLKSIDKRGHSLLLEVEFDEQKLYPTHHNVHSTAVSGFSRS